VDGSRLDCKRARGWGRVVDPYGSQIDCSTNIARAGLDTVGDKWAKRKTVELERM